MTPRDNATTGSPHPSVGAIVVAAGESRRMAGVDKVFAPLGGKPLLSYAMSALNDAPEVSDIVLVLSQANVELARRLVEESGWPRVTVCVGGTRRQDSVRCGLTKLSECQLVLVQDGARPFLDRPVISRGIEQAAETGAAVAAVPVVDTIKAAGADMTVTETVPRAGLWVVQTPQVFRRDLLEDAHRQVRDDVTDDAAMVERIGAKVRLFPGSPGNIKVTTPDDLAMAEALLRVISRNSAGD